MSGAGLLEQKSVVELRGGTDERVALPWHMGYELYCPKSAERTAST